MAVQLIQLRPPEDHRTEAEWAELVKSLLIDAARLEVVSTLIRACEDADWGTADTWEQLVADRQMIRAQMLRNAGLEGHDPSNLPGFRKA